MPSAALYVHVPFCLHKCPYCDFNAYSGLGRLIEPFVEALCREIGSYSGLHVPTISFGGGTPSLLSGAQLGRVLECCRSCLDVAPDAEISLEANPGTLDLPLLSAYRAAGVNRLSLGAQSFHHKELQWLGRDHTADQTRGAVAMAREVGFANLSLDLIFGLPGQSLTAWEESLRQALALAPDHLSCYALTVEERTPLGRRVAGGRTPEPDPDLQADMYERAHDILASAGFVHYEISNWAMPGYESRHNMTYWRNEPYVGVGPGAHSYFEGRRFSTVRAPGGYIKAAACGRTIAESEDVDPATDLFDTLTQGLRLLDGIDLEQVRRRHGPFDQTPFDRLDGLVERQGAMVRLTPRGRLLANEVSLALMP